MSSCNTIAVKASHALTCLATFLLTYAWLTVSDFFIYDIQKAYMLTVHPFHQSEQELSFDHAFLTRFFMIRTFSKS